MLKQIPNLITLTRLVVLVVLAWLVLDPAPGRSTWALVCFVYGAGSDFLDGYLARRFGWITDLGKFLDATVDKVMVLGSFLLLIWVGVVAPPGWALPLYTLLALVALREAVITWLRIVAARRGLIIAAEKGGKYKTIAQLLSLTAFFLVLMLRMDFPAVAPAVVSALWWLGLLLFLVSAWLALHSGVAYLRKFSSVWASTT